MSHTLAELLTIYQHDYLVERAASTQYAHLRFFAQVLRNLGDISLEDLTPSVLRAWKAHLETLHKPGTVHRYMTRLSAALNVAVKDLEWLPVNPMRKLRKPRCPHGVTRYLTHEERQHLLDACHRSRNPWLYPIVVIALTTAGRKNEVRCLRWEQVDLIQNVVALNVTKKDRWHPVPLVGEARTLLYDLAERRLPGATWVFPGPSGRQPRSIESAWRMARQWANLRDFRFHDLRHSCASYLAMSGATIQEIATILGHEDVQQSFKYIHLSPAHQKLVIEKMVAGFLTPPPPNAQDGPGREA